MPSSWTPAPRGARRLRHPPFAEGVSGMLFCAVRVSRAQAGRSLKWSGKTKFPLRAFRRLPSRNARACRLVELALTLKSTPAASVQRPSLQSIPGVPCSLECEAFTHAILGSSRQRSGKGGHARKPKASHVSKDCLRCQPEYLNFGCLVLERHSHLIPGVDAAGVTLSSPGVFPRATGSRAGNFVWPVPVKPGSRKVAKPSS